MHTVSNWTDMCWYISKLRLSSFYWEIFPRNKLHFKNESYFNINICSLHMTQKCMMQWRTDIKTWWFKKHRSYSLPNSERFWTNQTAETKDRKLKTIIKHRQSPKQLSIIEKTDFIRNTTNFFAYIYQGFSNVLNSGACC